MGLDQFCWGARALLTVLKLNLRDMQSGHQLMSPNISCFNQNFNLIFMTKTFLLNILDVAILFVISFVILCVTGQSSLEC